MPRNINATHGVSTVIEDPDQAESLRPTGYGMELQQKAGTRNWCHLPLATLVQRSGNNVDLDRIGFEANLNQNVEIVRLHLRHGAELVQEWVGPWRGPTVDLSFDLAQKKRVTQGVTLCLDVAFLDGTPSGQATFVSAFGRFQY